MIYEPGCTYAAQAVETPGWGLVKLAVPVGGAMITNGIPFPPEDFEKVQTKAWIRAQILQTIRASIELIEPDDFVVVRPNDGGNQESYVDEPV